MIGKTSKRKNRDYYFIYEDIGPNTSEESGMINFDHLDNINIVNSDQCT